MTRSPLGERFADYRILFKGDVEAQGADDRAMSLSPLSYWLCDRFDPERILTIGAGCELLHITMCEKAQAHVMQASCLHVAERFSSSFLEARKAYGSAKSQVLVPDPGAIRLGVEGQFDLIFMFTSAPISQSSIKSWMAALTADGLLVLCGEAEGELPTGDNILSWQFGPQKLILSSPKAPDGRITVLEQVSKALKASHSSLANALAACVADLTLQSKHDADQHFAKRLDELTQSHAADLISVTKKLAKLEQENIDLRQELKATTAQLAALQPQPVVDAEA